MTNRISKHYDDKYFLWQKNSGIFGAWANKTIFNPYIKFDDKVLEFGCGGGYLLKSIRCSDKIGIEINDKAIEQASLNSIKVFKSVEECPDNYFDIIYSTNALEHVLHPLLELQALHNKLKQDGKIIFIVPCESISFSFKENDINNHLYSWSPMNIGNLFKEAGFKVIESKPFIHKWPPKYEIIAKYFGRGVFNTLSKIYGRLSRKWFQVKVVATKE